jgi:hypothetical protein
MPVSEHSDLSNALPHKFQPVPYLDSLGLMPEHIISDMYREGALRRDFIRVPRWHSWLRHCATKRQVAGSIPDGVSGFFH